LGVKKDQIRLNFSTVTNAYIKYANHSLTEKYYNTKWVKYFHCFRSESFLYLGNRCKGCAQKPISTDNVSFSTNKILKVFYSNNNNDGFQNFCFFEHEMTTTAISIPCVIDTTHFVNWKVGNLIRKKERNRGKRSRNRTRGERKARGNERLLEALK
jgi:hypothetical protein